MRSRVFVVERPRPNIDLRCAEKFGELVLLFEAEDRRCSVFHSEQYGLAVLERLRAKNFDPLLDLLCVAGSMVPVTIAIAAAVLRYGRISVLLYNAAESSYVERTIGGSSWLGDDDDSEGSDSAAGDAKAPVFNTQGSVSGRSASQEGSRSREGDAR